MGWDGMGCRVKERPWRLVHVLLGSWANSLSAAACSSPHQLKLTPLSSQATEATPPNTTPVSTSNPKHLHNVNAG